MNKSHYLEEKEELNHVGFFLQEPCLLFIMRKQMPASIYQAIEDSRDMAKKIWQFLEPEDLPLWATQDPMHSKVLSYYDMRTDTEIYRCEGVESGRFEDALIMTLIKVASIAHLKG